jgi:hypothetical protein
VKRERDVAVSVDRRLGAEAVGTALLPSTVAMAPANF